MYSDTNEHYRFDQEHSDGAYPDWTDERARRSGDCWHQRIYAPDSVSERQQRGKTDEIFYIKKKY
jgi:hypothetical protein